MGGLKKPFQMGPVRSDRATGSFADSYGSSRALVIIPTLAGAATDKQRFIRRGARALFDAALVPLLSQAGHEFPIVLALSAGGSFLSYIYSAPPLKLKQSGWIGNYALGSSYISLPWWAGQAVFGSITPDVVVLTLLYSIAGLGIAIVNDFKSIEGDRAMGLNSLPVAFGVDTAKWICVASIDATQLSVAAYLAATGQTIYASVLLGLILPQIFFQYKYFIPDPIKNDVKYQVSAATDVICPPP